MAVVSALLSGPTRTLPTTRLPALSGIDWRAYCLAGIVAAAILCGGFLRVSYLIDHPMRYDEAYNYLHFASRSPAYIVTHYLPNNHVLHTLMVKVSTALLGTSPAALRLPALLGGLLLVPATAWLAWTISQSRMAAAIAAVAVSLSSPLVEYSSNARGYSWLAMFSVVSTILAIRYASSGERRHVIWWAVIGALGMYTAPIMAYPLFGQCAALGVIPLIVRKQPIERRAFYRRLAPGVGLLTALTLALYAPILLIEGTSGFRRGTQMAFEIHGAAVDSSWAVLLSACSLFTRHAPAAWAIAFGTGIVTFAAVSARTRNVSGLIALLTVAGAIGVVIATGTPLPARGWLFALPILLACFAAGCAHLVCWFDFSRVTASSGNMATRAWLSHPPARRAAGRGVLATCGIMLLLSPAWELRNQPRLVAEPGGLVEVREAVELCRQFAPQPCAIVSRYTPATAYYLYHLDIPRLASPDADGVRRVFIIEDMLKTLAELWNEHVPGYSAYGPARPQASLVGGTLYIAERNPSPTAASDSGEAADD